MMQQNRHYFEEAIVVEGRDDVAAVSRAVNAVIIETHGFGMSDEMWTLLERVYRKRGLIVFTDPDHGGRQIRKKVMERFPGSKEAFLSRDKATKKGDVGIENAAPEDILEALYKAKGRQEPLNDFRNDIRDEYSMDDLMEHKLIGHPDSKNRRVQLCESLGIGYSNGAGLLKKLNLYGIKRVDFIKETEKL